MMRKLAVTVFALSLAALGCGSDSGNQNTDVASSDGGQKDTIGALDGAQPDTSIVDGAAIDGAAKLDGAIDQNTAIDGAQVDGGVKIDANLVDTKPAVDGGAGLDTGTSSIDATAIDAGTAG
jgi:hypothetical protein